MDLDYNTIGKGYDATRCADPMIVEGLVRCLAPCEEGRYLDLACGSGNYTVALSELGYAFTGSDISEEMLEKARYKSDAVQWVQGDAGALSFDSGTFDGVTCIMATHHFPERLEAFREVFRVLRGGRFVIVTATPERIRRLWMVEYFPGLMEHHAGDLLSLSDMEGELVEAGFGDVVAEPFVVTREIRDHCLIGMKYKPEAFLDPAVREGMSIFHIDGFDDEVAEGVRRIEQDLRSGEIHRVIDSHEDGQGDGLFVRADKLAPEGP